MTKIVPLNPVHRSMHDNYRRMFLNKYGADWTGDAEALTNIIERNSMVGSDAKERDEAIVEDMHEIAAAPYGADNIPAASAAAPSKKLMDVWELKQCNEPVLTLRHRHDLDRKHILFVVEAGAYLDRDQVLMLRNWLNDWLGHTK